MAYTYTYTSAQLQAHHDKVAATTGVLVDSDNIDNYLPDDLTLEVSPLNNDWNGYLDPDHTVQIEFEDTSAGTRSFAADAEIAPNIFTSDTSNITFANDGWVLAGAIYKKFTFTAEQLALIDINTVPVFIKDELGNEHFVNNATNGVNVTKPSATELRVELTNAIFATLSITKVWRFFATERVGVVHELSPVALVEQLRSKLESLVTRRDVTGSRSESVTYTNNTLLPIKVTIITTESANGGTLQLNVNGSLADRSTNGDAATKSLSVSDKVLPNETYIFTLGGSLALEKVIEIGL